MADYETVVGYFSSQVQAEAAINALKQAGFQQDQIGVVAQTSQAGSASSDAQQAGTSQAYKAGQSAGGAWESVKIGIPPGPKEAHNSHTCAVKIRF